MRKKPDKPYHHGNLRLSLLRAAETILKTEGPAALTLRETARIAGVSHAAPYRHFADKDDLLVGLMELGFAALADAEEAGLAKYAGDAMAQLRACGLAYIEVARSYPERFRLMFGPFIRDFSKYPALQAIADRAFQGLLTAIKNCQVEKRIRQDDPMKMAIAAWSMVHGFASLMANEGDRLCVLSSSSERELAEYAVDTAMAGLKV